MEIIGTVLLIATLVLVGGWQWRKRQRTVKLIIPENVQNPAPVLIALHPHSTSGGLFARMSGFEELAQRDGVVVVFPSAYRYEWNDGAHARNQRHDDTLEILNLLESLAYKIPIDRQRIYLAGYSNGAMMAFRAVAESPNTFAGVASVAGTMIRRFADEPATPLDVFIMHGTDDRTIKPAGGTEYMSTMELAAHWARVDGCRDGDVFQQEPQFNEQLATLTAAACQHNVQVTLLENGRHEWLGSAEYLRGKRPPPRYDTSQLIWNFFGLDKADN